MAGSERNGVGTDQINATGARVGGVCEIANTGDVVIALLL
ncbi:hypothetical protein AF72_01460 [Xylella taiwanensis]|uniref:Uncharacterized protein n=1 Tax=Xylella taiwanensis TaxID=1444770 RepID=Z9JLG6_9GAMM|nr:hypothetical protein AF72_01460 [Xylella taiwanensis]